MLEPVVDEFLSVINYVFPSDTMTTVEYIKGIPIKPKPINEVTYEQSNNTSV